MYQQQAFPLQFFFGRLFLFECVFFTFQSLL
jgi:hypothetical protein